MADIKLIKDLRDRTGAGLNDCKAALEACDNDVDKACDGLREKDIQWLQHGYRDRFFADPFLLDEDSINYYILG